MKKYQKKLNRNEYGHITVVDKDNVQAIVNEKMQNFNRNDKFEDLGGLASFGDVVGDWRMIKAIADDVEYCFILIDNVK